MTRCLKSSFLLNYNISIYPLPLVPDFYGGYSMSGVPLYWEGWEQGEFFLFVFFGGRGLLAYRRVDFQGISVGLDAQAGLFGLGELEVVEWHTSNVKHLTCHLKTIFNFSQHQPFKLSISHTQWLLIQVSVPLYFLSRFLSRYTFTRPVHMVLLFLTHRHAADVTWTPGSPTLAIQSNMTSRIYWTKKC